MKNSQALMAVALALSASFAFAADPVANATPAAAAAPAYKAKKLDRAEVDALLAKPEKVLIIDVRRPDELTAIGGFPVYLSIPAKELENSLGFIPKDRTIVTVSNRASRSGKAADFLSGKGFKVAGTIGVKDYEEQGGKLTKIAPPAPKAEVVNTKPEVANKW